MGLRENLASEPVNRLALREPVLCAHDASVRSTIEQMRSAQLGCVIVTDDTGKPIGLFTEGSLAKLLAGGTNPLGDTVSEHAAADFALVNQKDPIARVLETMERDNTRFVVVVDDDGGVVGLTGQKGLMEYVADHFPQQVMVQRAGSPPPKEREGA